MDLPVEGIADHQLGDRLWELLGSAIASRRTCHGLAAPSGVPATGLAPVAAAPAVPTPEHSTMTVVVATRNRPASLASCIASILSGTLLPSRLVIVDNAPCDDDTAEMVERMAAAEPRLFYRREPVPGLSRAHNAALPIVHTPFVAFTDDDVVVDRRWLEKLVDGFAAGAHVACVTGLIAPAELDTLPQRWIEAHTAFGKGYERRVYDVGVNRPQDPLFPYAAGRLGSGANMAFRTDSSRREAASTRRSGQAPSPSGETTWRRSTTSSPPAIRWSTSPPRSSSIATTATTPA